MSSSEKHVAFQLKDFFNEDPLYIISHSSTREDISLFDAYDDYAQDLGCLRIAWQRIRQECKEIGEINAHQGHLHSSDEGYINESSSLFLKQRELMNILQYDVRSFIDIARTIMDKLAKIIEKLLGLSTGIGPRVSFTDHKKKLPTYPNIRPGYLDLLQNRTYWYEQELLLLRDKVFAQGNTVTTMPKISWIGGITILKT
jgi:hypothetical protein